MKAINSNRTDKQERITLWQNKLMQKVRAYNCEFRVDHLFPEDQAMVSYRFREGLEPVILLSSHLSQPDNKCGIMATLHELGHVIDYRAHDSDFHKYIAIGNGEVEVRAWENAFELARQIGFKPADYREMHEYAMECLYSYSNRGTDLFHYRDLQIGYYGHTMTWKEAQERMSATLSKALKQYQNALLGL